MLDTNSRLSVKNCCAVMSNQTQNECARMITVSNPTEQSLTFWGSIETAFLRRSYQSGWNTMIAVTATTTPASGDLLLLPQWSCFCHYQHQSQVTVAAVNTARPKTRMQQSSEIYRSRRKVTSPCSFAVLLIQILLPMVLQTAFASWIDPDTPMHSRTTKKYNVKPSSYPKTSSSSKTTMKNTTANRKRKPTQSPTPAPTSSTDDPTKSPTTAPTNASPTDV